MYAVVKRSVSFDILFWCKLNVNINLYFINGAQFKLDNNNNRNKKRNEYAKFR